MLCRCRLKGINNGHYGLSTEPYIFFIVTAYLVVRNACVYNRRPPFRYGMRTLLIIVVCLHTCILLACLLEHSNAAPNWPNWIGGAQPENESGSARHMRFLEKGSLIMTTK